MEGTCPSSDWSSSSVWQSVPRSKAGRSNVPIPEAAHGEGSQPPRLGQEAKSSSTSGAIGRPPKPWFLLSQPKSTQRSGLKEPGSPRPLVMSQEIPSFVNGGKRAREKSALLMR